MRKLSKLLIVLVALLAFTAIFATKTNAATIEEITFDGEYYLARYQDVAEAVNGDYDAAYNHYLTFGIKEGRAGSPLFDVWTYLNYNSDLYTEFVEKAGVDIHNPEQMGTAYVSAYNHFINIGVNEYRRSSYFFDAKYYVDSYEDLKNAFGDNTRIAYDHYLSCGINEGRNTTPGMNMLCYVSYKDLQAAFGLAKSGSTDNWAKYARHLFLVADRSWHNLDDLRSVRIEPSCTQDGSSYTSCQCGQIQSNIQKLEKLGHSPVSIPAVPASCTQDGSSSGSKCSRCGVVLSGCEEIKALGHDFEYDVAEHPELVVPTADGKGHQFKCEREGCDALSEVKDHVETEVPAVEANCSTKGVTAGTKCSVCGKILSGCVEQNVKPDVHVYDKGNFKNVTDEDDKSVGHVRVCDLCGQTEVDEKGAQKLLVHDFDYKTYEHPELVVPSADGKGHQFKCEVCGALDSTVYDHISIAVEGKEPTCTEDGLTSGSKCSVCGHIITEQTTIPALGHDGVLEVDMKSFDPETNTVTAHQKCNRCDQDIVKEYPVEVIPYLATCQAAGKTEYKVTLDNGEVVSWSEERPIIEHNDESLTLLTRPATCTVTGIKEGYYICPMCNEYFRKNDDGTYTQLTTEEFNSEAFFDKLPHDWKTAKFDWEEVKDENQKIKTYEVTITFTCDYCGKTQELKAQKYETVLKDEESNLYTMTAFFELDGKEYKNSKDVVIEVHNFNYQQNEEEHTGTCSYCNYVVTVAHSYPAEATDHNYNIDNGVVNHARACEVCGHLKYEVATYTQDGEYKHICGVCGKSMYHHFEGSWTYTNGGKPEVWSNTCVECGQKVYEKNIQDIFDHYAESEYQNYIKLGYNNRYNLRIPANGKLEVTGKLTASGDAIQNEGLIVLDDDAEISGSVHNIGEGRVEGGKNSSVDYVISGENASEVLAEALSSESTKSITLDTDATVEGNVTVNSELTIGEDATLTVAENANFATSQDKENTKVTVDGTLVVEGTLDDENLTIEGEGTVELKNDNAEENGKNIDNAFKAGAKNVELASDATLKSSENNTYSLAGNLTIDEDVTFTTEKGAHFTDGGNTDSSFTLNGTWKVEGEIRDLDRCTFGENSLIELASDTDTQNGQSLIVCAKSPVNKVQLDKNANLGIDSSSFNTGLSVEQDLTIVAAPNTEVKITTNSVNKNIDVSSGKTLKVEGVDFEFTEQGAGSKCFIVTEGTVDLTNSDITVKSGYGIYLKGASGKLEMNGGSITSEKVPCIGTNNVDTTESTINVTGAKLETKEENEPAVFLPAFGEATFTDCEIKGGSAIEAVNVKTLNLKGKTKLEATRSTYNSPNQTKGSESSGSALLIFSRAATNISETMTINVDNTVEFTEKAISGNDLGDIEVHSSDTPGVKTININGASGKTISGNYSTHQITVNHTPNA